MPKKSNNEKKKEALAAGKSAHRLPIRGHAHRHRRRTAARHPPRTLRLSVPSDTRFPCAEPKMTKQQEKAGRGGNAKKEAMKAKRAAAKDKSGW